MNSQTVRILLSKASSDALTAAGDRAFHIVGKVMRGTEEPATMGRWAITLAPLDWKAARDAAGVLAGTHRVVKIRKPKTSPKP